MSCLPPSLSTRKPLHPQTCCLAHSHPGDRGQPLWSEFFRMYYLGCSLQTQQTLPNYLNSNTIKGSVTSVSPFQPVSAEPHPTPHPRPHVSWGPRPLWNPVPSFFPRRPCLPFLNSVEHRALNPQLPVFLAKRGKFPPSGGDPESRSSPGLPLDDTRASARSGASCRRTPLWSTAWGLTPSCWGRDGHPGTPATCCHLRSPTPPAPPVQP